MNTGACRYNKVVNKEPGRGMGITEVEPCCGSDDVPSGAQDQSHVGCTPRRDQPYSVEHRRAPLLPNTDRQRSKITGSTIPPHAE